MINLRGEFLNYLYSNVNYILAIRLCCQVTPDGTLPHIIESHDHSRKNWCKQIIITVQPQFYQSNFVQNKKKFNSGQVFSIRWN